MQLINKLWKHRLKIIDQQRSLDRETIGEVIAEANMCSLGTKIKPGINSIAKQVDKNKAQELWNKLKLNDNELVSNDLKPDLFALITEYSDVFTSENCQVGDTSWVEFKIELNENANR